MKVSLYTLVIGWTLLCSAMTLGQEKSTETGKVLILSNERALSGDIERVGERYRVRRKSGEMWLPISQALRLCGDWQEARKFVSSRADLLDPDERLRLARWCRMHGLYEEAYEEVRAALKLRPRHRPTRQLERILKRLTEEKEEGSSRAKIKRTSAVVAAPPPSGVAVGPSELALFATRIHAILMNTCARCHTGGRGGSFQLWRASKGGARVTMQRNLDSAVRQINLGQPELSPLLVKAISLHGGARKPALKSRQSLPYRTLDYWVRQIAAGSPQGQTKVASSEVPEAAPEPRRLPKFLLRQNPVKPRKVKVEASNGEEEESEPTPRQIPVRKESTPPPAKLPVDVRNLPSDGGRFAGPRAPRQPRQRVEDPYDPGVFNRQMHPDGS